MDANKGPVWRLVQECAHALTQQGHSPFSRKDLIECVRLKAPHYRPNTINPIIQGVTENLRGGAPGADGKNILRRVSRGRFVLVGTRNADGGGADGAGWRKSESRELHGSETTMHSPAVDERGKTRGSVLCVCAYPFTFVCDLELERADDGSIRRFYPQSRYAERDRVPLHRYGAGPFCRFLIPHGRHEAGVYVFTVDAEMQYVGECAELTARFNAGYDRISPRNCFKGGRETNCRINTLIAEAAGSGSTVSLWFFETSDRKAVEAELRRRLAPPWNAI